MVERVLSLALLLAWQAAMLTAAEIRQGLIGAATSLAVGIALLVLLISGVRHGANSVETDEDVLFEQLAFSLPVH